MNLYFDNCVWERFFDSPTKKIKKEKNKIEKLLELRKKGKIKITSSDANEAELIPLEDKGRKNDKDNKWNFIREHTDFHVPTSYGVFSNHPKWNISNTAGFTRKETEELIEQIKKYGIKHDDAVQLSTAIEEACDIFVTVDGDLLNKGRKIDKQLLKSIVNSHPRKKLKKVIGASPVNPIKILSPEDTIREIISI